MSENAESLREYVLRRRPRRGRVYTILLQLLDYGQVHERACALPRDWLAVTEYGDLTVLDDGTDCAADFGDASENTVIVGAGDGGAFYRICKLLFFCCTGVEFEMLDDPYSAVARLCDALPNDAALQTGDNVNDDINSLVLEGLTLREHADRRLLTKLRNKMEQLLHELSELDLDTDSFVIQYAPQEPVQKPKGGRLHFARYAMASMVVSIVLLGGVCYAAFNRLGLQLTSSGLVLASSVSATDLTFYTYSEEKVIDSARSTIVPSLVGKKWSDIKNAYTDIDVRLVYEECSDEYAEGYIIAQTINAGALVIKNTPVGVTVSLGKSVSVPDLAGLTVDEALEALTAQGLFLGQQLWEHNEEIASGYVISAADGITEAAKGSAIDIVVSSGSESTTTSATTATGSTATRAASTSVITTTTTQSGGVRQAILAD